MPFASRRQQRFFYSNPGKLGGLKHVAEWSRATDFKHLPERASKGKIRRPTRRKKQ